MNEGTINAEVTMDGAVGVLLVNRYRVLKQLGQGGMGSVWLAEDTKLDGRKVAVKMLPSILVSNKRAYAQVKQEALVSLKLTHPNIVAVRAFEEEGGNPFLVMDYIEGQTLDDYLAEKSKLSEEEAVRLLKPVAAALDYAHSQGVVHRDVKPGNVMIDGAGHPYVLDFGIAREVQETMTRVTGKLSSGTLMYMSPEQLHGVAPKSAQDVYSFAAMVYECLKGEPPFSRGQIEYQIEHDVPEPLSRHIAICRGVMAGLEKTPEARPSTCAAVLENDGKRAAKTGVGTSAGKTRIAAVVLGGLALGAFVVIGWWWQERAKSEGQRVKNVALAAERARKAEEARQEAEKRKAEEEKVAAEAEVRRVAEENRRAELAAFQLSAKTDSVHEQIGREPDEMRAFFAAEIRAFENDRKAGDDAKLLSKNVTATNFFTAALAKATALKAAVDLRMGYLSSRAKAETARKSADSVGAKDAQTARYAAAQKRLSAADALAAGRNFADAIATVETATRDFATLRSDVIRETLDLAKSHGDAERWHDCLAAVVKVLGGDQRNDEAIALKKEAERRLCPKIGDIRTIPLPGGATMEMAWCPATTSEEWKRISGGKDYFIMGSPETENMRGDSEKQHRVMLTQGFWLGKYEVTQCQWERVMGSNPSDFKGSNHPVEKVSWEDCQEFIRKINACGQVCVSLPTEAQWEYACRAGTTTPFSFGTMLNGDMANCDGNYPYGTAVKGRILHETESVGSYAPNAWGLYDMHGNVWEWCQDWYDTDYYNKAPICNPACLALGERRVCRGGCWLFNAHACRSAYRHGRYGPDFRFNGLGFRLVCSGECVKESYQDAVVSRESGRTEQRAEPVSGAIVYGNSPSDDELKMTFVNLCRKVMEAKLRGDVKTLIALICDEKGDELPQSEFRFPKMNEEELQREQKTLNEIFNTMSVCDVERLSNDKVKFRIEYVERGRKRADSLTILDVRGVWKMIR